MKVFPERLRKARLKKGLLQKELAAKLNITRNAVSQYERGKRVPDMDTVERIADVLNVSVDYLLGRTNNPEGIIVFEDRKPDLEAPFREKTLAGALLKVSELVYEFNLPEDMAASLVMQVIKKYGPPPAVGGIAAHGPQQPGTIQVPPAGGMEGNG